MSCQKKAIRSGEQNGPRQSCRQGAYIYIGKEELYAYLRVGTTQLIKEYKEIFDRRAASTK